MDGWAAHPMGWGGDGVVASPVEAPGVSLIARRCLSGATPRGQSWTSAGLLPHGRNGLNAQRMAVVSTFREPSLCRHVPRELWRSVWLDLPPIIAVTACHQRNCVERYSRYNAIERKLFAMKGFHHPEGSQQVFLTGLAHLYNLIPYQRRAQHAGQCGVEVEGGKVPTQDWLLNLQILTSGGFR